MFLVVLVIQMMTRVAESPDALIRNVEDPVVMTVI